MEELITSLWKDGKEQWIKRYKRLFSVFISKKNFESSSTSSLLVLGQFNELIKDEKDKDHAFSLLKKLISEIEEQPEKRDELYYYGDQIIQIILQRFY